MGFNAQRGDSMNLLNSAFNDIPDVIVPELPLWKQTENIAMAKDGLKYLLMGGAGLYLFFGIVRPAYRNLVASLKSLIPEPPAHNSQESAANKEFEAKKSEISYESSLQAAKQMAQQSPKVVASVVQEWVNK